MQKLYKSLSEYAIEYIGCTKSLDFKCNRTHEIRFWISKHQNEFNIIQWIAIDDLPLHDFDHNLMKNHFIHTNIQYGLTDDDIAKCVDLLNNSN